MRSSETTSRSGIRDSMRSPRVKREPLYATGVTSMAVQFISRGNGIETNGPPEFHFKVLPGLNTYQIRLNSINQPSWAEPKVNHKDVLKKLTEIKIVASCNQCVQTKGTVVVDNLIFQN